MAEEEEEKKKAPATFAELGLNEQLCIACEDLKFTKPTDIQKEAIPYALEGRDIIGLAQTGSGKTAAFALPVLQALWEDPKPFFCCVLAPTRELAYQISEQFAALGSTIGVRCAVLVGGVDNMQQSIALSKRPHIIVATPGRLDDHLQNTKGFSLKNLKYLILDEADRLLDMDFGPVIDKILKSIPRERNTYLFSATMTTKVAKLQRASLSNPVKLEISSKYQTVSTLVQNYILTPHVHKDAHLVHLLTLITGGASRTIIFTRTIHDCARVAILLRLLSFQAIPIHGQLSQSARLGALNKFKSAHGLPIPTENNDDEDGGEAATTAASSLDNNNISSNNNNKSGNSYILVATDVAARGLDIPQVDYVINYDIPSSSKDYIHRVGRTARAGRSGKSISLVSQYDVELLQRIEGVIGIKLTEFPGAQNKDEVALLSERVAEAQREAARQIRESDTLDSARMKKKKLKRGASDKDDQDRDDDLVEAGMPRSKPKKSRRRR